MEQAPESQFVHRGKRGKSFDTKNLIRDNIFISKTDFLASSQMQILSELFGIYEAGNNKVWNI